MSDNLVPRLRRLFKKPGFKPLNKTEIARTLGVRPEAKSKLRDALKKLEADGEIERGQKARYGPPNSSGKLLTGTLRFRSDGAALLVPDSSDPNNAKLLAPYGDDVYPNIGARHTLTALPGDRVSARLTSGPPSTRSSDNKGKRKGRGKRTGPPSPSGAPRPEARLVKILERGQKRFTGIFRQKGKFCSVEPSDPSLPSTVRIKKENAAGATPGDLVVALIDRWESRTATPAGHVVKCLGNPDAPGADILGIIYQYDLPLEFPAEVLDEAAATSEKVPAKEIKRREDWRSKPVMTIDPFDAKDFDDAVHVTRLPNNKGWELAVHIADVSHYVTPCSALDKEARSRGNSTYLVDRVIPMLPETLSNGICSLKPRVDRLTRAVVMRFSKDGTMTSSRFTSAVINSKHRLTYEQAYAILIGQTGARPVVPVPKNYKHPSHAPAPPKDAALTKHLQSAWALASTLRKRRFAKGSLDLDFPEVKVHVDRKTGKPSKLERVEYDESHQMIEEFMLAANEAVAKRVQDSSKPAIYRIHEDPDPAKLFEFAELARAHGIKTGDLTLKGEIQKMLLAIRGNAEEHALKISLLKSLKRAAYSITPVGHFGLAKKHYTHFTSPIRRYADLVVHRVLDGIIDPGRQKTKLPKQAQMAEICEHISTTERNSSDAETQSVRLKELEYLDALSRRKKQPAMPAVINEIKPIGLFVELSEYMIRGLVHRDSLRGGNDLRFESARNTFEDSRGRATYKAGQTIRVHVDRVDFERLRVDFKPA